MGEFQLISNPARFVASVVSKISATKQHFSNSTRAGEISVRREAKMNGTRRKFFQDAAILGAGLFGMSKKLSAQSSGDAGAASAQTNHSQPGGKHDAHGHPAGHAAGGTRDAFLPMVTPDVADLPYEMDGAAKVFKLVAEPVKRKIAPFKTIDVCGYNGSCPGPTIQVQQGDRGRVVLENHLPESTTLHWHGLEIPIEQDGVPRIIQQPSPPDVDYAKA